jgi:COMPASS component SWD1
LYGAADPFRNNFPEVIEETSEEGYALTCAFNRRGTLLATGCHDGRCIVWDFDTKGIAVVLAGHVHPVTSVR